MKGKEPDSAAGSNSNFNEEDMALSFIVPNFYGENAEGGVRMRVSRLVPKDIGVQESMDLAVKACRLACLGADVIRGRLPGRMLERFVSDDSLDRIMYFSQLIQGDKHEGPLHRHMPSVPTYLFGTVVNHDCFDACVGLSVGYDDYRVSLVLRRKGGRWLCTVLDFG
ncbi:hypothetical protein [Bifidobacterium vansinderenii]|uniref:Uncharacterized protein n=1 Tax=Bifidobacterium vansinderenii TaxID=1984871 RepID=A0A229VUK1_9BIFI|nr:hypothetical protein [Bifidobacterium vansinderenii]OXM99300.1 hypothetical protein Tam10B_2442 [Bifidobacterium vansinderenii]